ncbi:thermostable hemolysin [Streptosporangium soli]|nr:thermostable hemolysin [Streptosporangium sp. KLBMP 9127]
MTIISAESPFLSIPPSETAQSGAAAALRFQTGFAHPGTPEYQSCVDLVKRKYLDRYGAAVDPRPDLFLTVSDDTPYTPASNRLRGLAGLTTAAGRRLLSENYLDVPVEQACADLAPGTHVDRGRIAEMGPLTSFYPGTGMVLMRSLPSVALYLGYDFLLSTLTEKLHGLAKTAGWDFHTLTNARRADLAGVHTADWGTYYSSKPRTGILRCERSVALQTTG